ncbi:molecular chaperone TorD family protein [Paracoccaceae bacterium Fryx2]|nr:molecular chaperone TorD family protein [Paracoccaceae bacterium Fryx2]
MNTVRLHPARDDRADCYAFLGAQFSDCPEPAHLACMRSLADGAGAAEPGTCDAVLTALLPETDMALLSARLQAEQARLFCGAGEGYTPPLPCESAWRNDRTKCTTIHAVAQAYAEAGYWPAHLAGPLDHLAEQLRFMAALCQAETEALRLGNARDARVARSRQRDFLDNHLLVWVPGYCRRLGIQTAEPFFRAVLSATAQLIEAEMLYHMPVARRVGAR